MSSSVRGYDPVGVGHSMANLTELMFPLLEAVSARSLLEVGAYAGDLSRELLHWAELWEPAAGLTVIDPEPQAALEELAATSALTLVAEPSIEALEHLAIPDAIVIDGDHNYFTVSEELRVIDERLDADDAPMPLMLFHDVCWPHARRDSYYVPDRIPTNRRQPLATKAEGGIAPGEPGMVAGGFKYPYVAATEGGPGNGVLTAIEDFVADRGGLRMAIVPAFFGLGVIWAAAAPGAPTIEAILAPFAGAHAGEGEGDDRAGAAGALMGRVEANRVHHAARTMTLESELAETRERLDRHERVLRGLSASRRFALVDRMITWRRGGSTTWGSRIEKALRG